MFLKNQQIILLLLNFCVSVEYTLSFADNRRNMYLLCIDIEIY